MPGVLSANVELPGGKTVSISLDKGQNPLEVALAVCQEHSIARSDEGDVFNAVLGSLVEAADAKAQPVQIQSGEIIVKAAAGESAREVAAREAATASHVDDEDRGEYEEAVAEALAQARLERIVGISLQELLPGDEEYDDEDEDSDIGPPTEPASPAKLPQMPSKQAEAELRQRNRQQKKKVKPETEEQRRKREKREAEMEKQFELRKAREDAQCVTSVFAFLAGFILAAVIASLSIMADARVDRSVPMATGLVVIVLTALYQSFATGSNGSTLDEETVHPLVWTMGGAGMGCMMGSMAGDIMVNMGFGFR